jgi:hypothetical protein
MWRNAKKGAGYYGSSNLPFLCKALALLLILLIMVVSLGCGARVWEEAHRETNSLRAYVGNVEAAAAGLLSCVQELEHLLTLCT